MGLYPPPFYTNLFLFYHEWQCINNLQKENVKSARKLYLIFRFISDLLEQNVWNIYPVELRKNKINSSANFIDLKYEDPNSTFQTKFYDKGDNFDFNIIRMT